MEIVVAIIELSFMNIRLRLRQIKKRSKESWINRNTIGSICSTG